MTRGGITLYQFHLMLVYAFQRQVLPQSVFNVNQSCVVGCSGLLIYERGYEILQALNLSF
ncbi:hypothetical protein HDF16_002165 [Granulicella aggregans]|uniref:Uncharacterized protein n=1 Tax=Granulicella aggregans TaxID=474949 RepID=A0A7W7ZCM0_9BACT|nr:hypothetical protein [Granulicella aggregans]MBB5057459.1 hypothetical protein [Granulicella aggregans]